MLIVLSPAKSLDYESPIRLKDATLPDMLDKAVKAVELILEKGALAAQNATNPKPKPAPKPPKPAPEAAAKADAAKPPEPPEKA